MLRAIDELPRAAKQGALGDVVRDGTARMEASKEPYLIAKGTLPYAAIQLL